MNTKFGNRQHQHGIVGYRTFGVTEQIMEQPVGMKTDWIQTDITDIISVFIFLVGFGFEYG
jgi:hypothetical protein